MAYDVVNAADLPQETSTTLDGTEQLIGFDTAQGKRVTVNDLAEYILQRKLSSLAGASQTVAAALTALNSKMEGMVIGFWNAASIQFQIPYTPSTSHFGDYLIFNANRSVMYLLQVSVSPTVTKIVGSQTITVDITDKTVTLTPNERLWGMTVIVGVFK